MCFRVCAAGVGVEGERVGEGKRNAAGEVHGGAEQTVGWGRRRPLHAHHQQCDGVRLPVHLQLHGLEFIRPRHHDHLPGDDGCVLLVIFLQIFNLEIPRKLGSASKQILKVTRVSPFYSCKQTFACLTFPPLFSLTPFISEEVPVGIIAGGTVGSTILLFIFLLVLVLIFYRQRKGSESYSQCAYTLQRPDLHVL